MDGKDLLIHMRLLGVTEGGVEEACKAKGLDRRNVQRIANGERTPSPATLRKLFAFATKDGVRPPYFDFGRKRYLDPESSDAIAKDCNHWRARALNAEAQLAALATIKRQLATELAVLRVASARLRERCG